MTALSVSLCCAGGVAAIKTPPLLTGLLESQKVDSSFGKFDFDTLDFGLLQIFVGEGLLVENKSVVPVEASDNKLAIFRSATFKFNGVCSTFAKVNGVLAPLL